MLRRLVLFLLLGLPPAQAEEASLPLQPETATGAASQLVLAHHLFRKATEMGDPVLLLAAIRLTRGVTIRPALGWERTRGGEGEAPPVAGPTDPGSTAALAMLQGLAVDDPDLQDLVYDLDAQVPPHRLPVATVAKAGLGNGLADEWRLPLSGSVIAEIAVIGDGGAALGLSVTDEAGGDVVCARPPTLDPALCRFTPARNGFFTVTIVNAGAEWAGYQLLGN